VLLSSDTKEMWKKETQPKDEFSFHPGKKQKPRKNKEITIRPL